MLDELQLTYTSYNGQNLNSPAVSIIRGSTVFGFFFTCILRHSVNMYIHIHCFFLVNNFLVETHKGLVGYFLAFHSALHKVFFTILDVSTAIWLSTP
jgi:hypothetical protein